MAAMHYVNDSATGEFLLISAELEHADTDITLEYRDGRWIVDGVASVDTFRNARELITGEAA